MEPLACLSFSNVGGDVAISDLDGDGIPDLVAPVSSAPNGRVDLWIGNGDGTFSFLQGFDTTAINTVSVIISDMDGDGFSDLVTVNRAPEYGLSFLLGNGDGTFQTAQYLGTGKYPNSVAAFDLNGDGNLDP